MISWPIDVLFLFLLQLNHWRQSCAPLDLQQLQQLELPRSLPTSHEEEQSFWHVANCRARTKPVLVHLITSHGTWVPLPTKSLSLLAVLSYCSSISKPSSSFLLFPSLLDASRKSSLLCNSTGFLRPAAQPEAPAVFPRVPRQIWTRKLMPFPTLCGDIIEGTVIFLYSL